MRKPKAVQIEALRRSEGKRGFGFIMEQGLGKTGTDLMETCEDYAEEAIECAVTICPNTFKQGWREEVHEWGMPISTYLYDSTATPYIRRNEGLQNLVVNIEAIRSDGGKRFINKFINGRKYKITCDESIALANPSSKQTKDAIELAKGAERRRILSGRWIRNAPDDTWGQLRFIGALDGYMYHPFKYKYCKMGGFKGKQAEGFAEGMEEPFAKMVAPWTFQALKKDWGLDIGRTYSQRFYKLTPDMQRHFDMMFNEFMVFLDNGDEVAIDIAIAKYEKMSQIQCGYIIKEDRSIAELVEPNRNPRLLALRQFREDEVPTKICIPYSHRYAGKLLRDAFPNAAVIGGGQSPDETGEQKLRFNNDPRCREILLQTRASKYGHTLLGNQNFYPDHCSTMAFFENTYSMDDRAQIEDRIHREGQQEEACGYVDFIGTSIDHRMVEALARRQSVWQAFIAARAAIG